MSKIHKCAVALLFSTALAGMANPASAVTWNITGVLGGSSGFGASSFHDASGSNVMSGPLLANIPQLSGAFGTFDDVTGQLAVTLLTDNAGQTFTLQSTGANDFDFSGAGGTLASNASLDISFSGAGLNGLTTTTLGFLSGFVCCGSSGSDPNSFTTDGLGGAIMTLWGADGFNVANGFYDDSSIGMDLRLELTTVPVPAALPLLASGLGLFGFFGWRRRKSATA